MFSSQTIAIGWIFGVQKFANCVEQMTGFKPNLYWTLTWGVVAPGVMAVIFLFYCFRWEPVKYGTVEYPAWAHTIGFFMSLSSMVWIPGYAVYWMCTTRGSIKDVSFLSLAARFIDIPLATPMKAATAPNINNILTNTDYHFQSPKTVLKNCPEHMI